MQDDHDIKVEMNSFNLNDVSLPIYLQLHSSHSVTSQLHCGSTITTFPPFLYPVFTRKALWGKYRRQNRKHSMSHRADILYFLSSFKNMNMKKWLCVVWQKANLVLQSKEFSVQWERVGHSLMSSLRKFNQWRVTQTHPHTYAQVWEI